jgi:hypothetical protein
MRRELGTDYTGIPRSTAVAIFDDRISAEQAVDALRHAGFSDEQIGFALRGSRSEGAPAPPHTQAAEGAATGAVAGASSAECSAPRPQG